MGRRNRRAGSRRVSVPLPVVPAIAVVVVVVGVLVLVCLPGAYSVSPVGAYYRPLTWPLVIAGIVLAYLLFVTHALWRAARGRDVEVTVATRAQLTAPDAGEGGQLAIPADRSPAMTAEQEAAVRRFRQVLSSMHLSTCSPLPGVSSSQSLIEEVQKATPTAVSPWAFLGTVISALAGRSRSHMYVVSLAPHDERTMTVEVSNRLSLISDRFGRGVDVATVQGRTADETARRAACQVAAHVLPRTVHSRVPPWTPWRGIRLDPELFYHVHEGLRLSRAQRFEEAVESFDRAIAQDPLNPFLRLEKAAALDQLGLYVEALASYFDVVMMERWHDRRSWAHYRSVLAEETGGGGSPEPWRPGLSDRDEPGLLTRSPNGLTAMAVARYRLACSLAASERVVRQWVDGGPSELRIRPLIEGYRNQLLRVCADVECSVTAPEQLRSLLQYAAYRESRALSDDFRWFRVQNLCRSLPIPPRAVRLLPLWAEIQCRYAGVVQRAANLASPPGRNDGCPGGGSCSAGFLACPARRWLGDGHDGVNDDWAEATTTWPPSFEDVETRVRRVFGRRPMRRLGWLDNYNIACTLAICMLTPETRSRASGEAGRDHWRFVDHAVEHLACAVVHSDSQFAASRSGWLRQGDQDLNYLRYTNRYEAFISRFFPHDSDLRGPGQQRVPASVVELTVSLHVRRLVTRYAAVRGAHWKGTARPGTPPHDLVAVEQLQEEAEWWQVLVEYCDVHGGSLVQNRSDDQKQLRWWRAPAGRDDVHPRRAGPNRPDNREQLRARGRLIERARRGISGDGEFDTALPTIDTDPDWRTLCEERTGAAGRHATGSSGDGQGLTEWIDKRQEIENLAARLLRARRRAMGQLGDVVRELPGTVSHLRASLGGSGHLSVPARRELAGAMAEVWAEVEAVMAASSAPVPGFRDLVGAVARLRELVWSVTAVGGVGQRPRPPGARSWSGRPGPVRRGSATVLP